MPVNLALGHVSNDFLIAALVIYSLSVVAFAGDFAFGRPRRAASAARGQQAQERTTALATVGAASAAAAGDVPADGAPGGPAAGEAARGPAASRTRCPSWPFPRCARSARRAGGSRRPWRWPRSAWSRTRWPW